MNLIRKSKRINLTCLVIIGLIASLSFAASNASAQKRQFLSVGTAPPGGAFFVVGGAIAQVVSNHTGDMNWEVSAEATKGTQENIRRLAKGELGFALANAAISYFAVRGEGAWKGEQPNSGGDDPRSQCCPFYHPTIFQCKEALGFEGEARGGWSRRSGV